MIEAILLGREAHRRPSFTGDGRTDGSDYAWVTWLPSEGRRRRATRLGWL